MRFAFHRDFNSVTPGGRRGDCVGSPRLNPLRCNVQRQELAGQVSERNLSTVRWPEAKRLYVVSELLDFCELELAEPSDLPGLWVVLFVSGRSRAHQRGLRFYLDARTS